MNSTVFAGPGSRSARPWLGWLTGGLLAGTFDIVYAITATGLRGRTPEWLLQTVASGLVGRNAFDMGTRGALLGLFCHFAIMMVIAGVFFFAYRQVEFLRRQVWVAGIVFGICAYLVMNFAVLPLSAFPLKMSYPVSALLQGFLSHAVLIGLPIALSVRHFSSRR